MPHRRLSSSDWWEQSRRDLRAAEHLLNEGFSAHAVALAHLAVEKSMKAILRDRSGEAPPVTHNLSELMVRVGGEWPADLARAIDELSRLDITLLYEPDAFFRRRLPDHFENARHAVADARSVVEWIQHQLESS
ncbi:hypothetical protein CRI94_03865 [Longibacter salinarum]|uniref:HEPN domain-containing protein n=1 Tax=Longibacter salinarum TaxID=1850348 RepID=A0A2A8D057_9BACT|nr:HEPN domain-containing protein [Longibacter salinarum]PEN14187.1 hypothetical protein CRI94_03865 [Longibacter salinarum]